MLTARNMCTLPRMPLTLMLPLSTLLPQGTGYFTLQSHTSMEQLQRRTTLCLHIFPQPDILQVLMSPGRVSLLTFPLKVRTFIFHFS